VEVWPQVVPVTWVPSVTIARPPSELLTLYVPPVQPPPPAAVLPPPVAVVQAPVAAPLPVPVYVAPVYPPKKARN
jgi:hypothetical protein